MWLAPMFLLSLYEHYIGFVFPNFNNDFFIHIFVSDSISKAREIKAHELIDIYFTKKLKKETAFVSGQEEIPDKRHTTDTRQRIFFSNNYERCSLKIKKVK